MTLTNTIVTGQNRAARKRHRNGTVHASHAVNGATWYCNQFCNPEALCASADHLSTASITAAYEVQVDLLRT